MPRPSNLPFPIYFNTVKDLYVYSVLRIWSLTSPYIICNKCPHAGAGGDADRIKKGTQKSILYEHQRNGPTGFIRHTQKQIRHYWKNKKVHYLTQTIHITSNYRNCMV